VVWWNCFHYVSTPRKAELISGLSSTSKSSKFKKVFQCLVRLNSFPDLGQGFVPVHSRSTFQRLVRLNSFPDAARPTSPKSTSRPFQRLVRLNSFPDKI